MLEENQKEIQNQLPETEQDSVKKEKKKHPFRNGFLSGVAVCLVIALMVVIVKETMLHSTVGSGFMTRHGVEKVNLLSDVIDQYYYKDITDEEKMEGIYKGLMSSTNDKYTDYYSPKEFKDLMVTMEGDYGGIGATLSQDKATKEVSVVEVYEGSPAARAGLERGDIVISVDGHLGTDESLDDFVQRIRGEEGTSIEMVYKRDDQEHTIEITREEVIVPSVSHRMLDDKIGYIRISSFVNGTQKDFEDALADLQSQGMQGIVFDMRDNGGGMVDSVVAILDDILPAGTVVYTMDKSGKREDYTSDDAKKIDIPVTVLVNENTASASLERTPSVRASCSRRFPCRMVLRSRLPSLPTIRRVVNAFTRRESSRISSWNSPMPMRIRQSMTSSRTTRCRRRWKCSERNSRTSRPPRLTNMDYP